MPTPRAALVGRLETLTPRLDGQIVRRFGMRIVPKSPVNLKNVGAVLRARCCQKAKLCYAGGLAMVLAQLATALAQNAVDREVKRVAESTRYRLVIADDHPLF